MKFPLMHLIAAIFFLIAFPAQAFDQSKVEIVSAVSAVDNMQEIDAAIKISLPDGWYTYWRMPGDAGLAPVFTWGNQENIESIRIDYPAPKRFITADLHSFGYGYGGDVYLPLTIGLKDKSASISTDLKLDMMICKDICIPETHEVSFSLDRGEAVSSGYAPAIEKAKDTVPIVKDLPRLKLNTAVLGKESIVITADARDGFEGSEVIIEVKDDMMNAPPEMIQGADETQAVFKIPAPDYIDNLTDILFGEMITVTLINKGHAVEKEFQF